MNVKSRGERPVSSVSGLLPIGFVLLSCASLLGGCAHTRTHFQENRFGDVSDGRDGGMEEQDVMPETIASGAEIERMQSFVDAHRVRIGIVQTLVMPEGDVVDCVELQKQPSLQRAEMRGHRVRLQPSSMPAAEDVATATAASADARPLGVAAFQSYGTATPYCPAASVPILRLTLERVARFATLADFLQKVPLDLGSGSDLFVRDIGTAEHDAPRLGPTDRHQYAAARRNVANWGAESVLNVWRPYNEVSKEFSLSQIWVARGAGDNLETVEAGWQKYKKKYGNWNSRLFIYFTPDNYKKDGDGCYNLDCGKFVQVDNSVYIGGAFDKYSTKGGDQRTIKLLWYKDGTRGDWWLRYSDKWVGYYPRELFDGNGLRDQGDRVTFGGEITDYRTDGRHTRTDMGSGRWPYEGFRWAAYQRSVRYVDTNNFYRQATGLGKIVTDRECYDIELGSSTGAWEQHFYFGGSGYNKNCE